MKNKGLRICGNCDHYFIDGCPLKNNEMKRKNETACEDFIPAMSLEEKIKSQRDKEIEAVLDLEHTIKDIKYMNLGFKVELMSMLNARVEKLKAEIG